jgi:hypothetical protein
MKKWLYVTFTRRSNHLSYSLVPGCPHTYCGLPPVHFLPEQMKVNVSVSRMLLCSFSKKGEIGEKRQTINETHNKLIPGVY